MSGDSRVRRARWTNMMPCKMNVDRAASVRPRRRKRPARRLGAEGKRAAAVVRVGRVAQLQRHKVGAGPQPILSPCLSD